MKGSVVIAVAGDLGEADEIRGVLARAGIEASIEGAETDVAAVPLDGPCRICVAEAHVEAARDALEEHDELGEDVL